MTDRVVCRLNFTGKLLPSVAGWLAAVALVGMVDASQSRAQSAAADHSNGIADTWQGTLHAGRDLRIVFKISKADDGGYKAMFYSIDQAGGDGLPASKVTVEAATVKILLPIGAYEGKLSSDGKTIAGTWTQGAQLPLDLARATPETEWTIPPPRPKMAPMAANADPNFDVATIKPNNSGAPGLQGLTMNGRNFKAVNSSLSNLITFAFKLQAKQIVNGPDWLEKDRYDIAAVPEQEGAPNPEQLRIMMQKLLADRFKLTFHHDKKELSAYLLTVSKSGSKLTPTQMQGPLPGFGFGPGTGGLTLRAMNITLPDFASFLQLLVMDRPVVDETGLTGKYDFNCTFSPDDSQFNGHPPKLPQQTDTTDASAAPSLYDAFQQQLGLKLSAEKAPVDVIVIDHVEKPSQN